MKYIDHISINGVRGDIPVTQAKSGAPTTKTEGRVGQLYMDTATGDLYKCTAAGATYVWVKIEISSGGDSPIELIENTDKTNKKPLRSLNSGTYILKGYFTAYEGSTASYTFSTGMLVAVVKTTSISYVQIFYPKDNCIQYLYITDTEVTRKDAKLVNMESIANKVTEVSDSSDDSHYPSAKAVNDAIVAAKPEIVTPSATATNGQAASAKSVYDLVGNAKTLGVTGASVGDIVKVKAVDESGKPTEWEAADDGEKWELIKSIETTEDVSGVTITTDLSGNAFSLKKCRIEGIFPVGAGNGLWYFYLSPNTQFYGTSSWGTGNNPSTLKIDADMTTKPAYALGFRRKPDLTLEAVWMERKSLDYESITAVRILNFSELTLPIGSKITVWGIKA